MSNELIETIKFLADDPGFYFCVVVDLAGNVVFGKIFSDLFKRHELKLIRSSKKCKIISESDLLKREKELAIGRVLMILLMSLLMMYIIILIKMFLLKKMYIEK